MATEPAWQARSVEQLSQFFRNEPDAKAFVLTGSLAAAHVQEDAWSDVDASIVVADRALDLHYLSTGWLHALGRVVGVERHEHPLMRTLRVCLEGFQRLDLVFVAESALEHPSLWERNPFHPSYIVQWSKLPGLETQIASLPVPAEYQGVPGEAIEEMVEAFWLRAAVVITKVVRNDLLIGLHLALDLARDSLVLQMMRRDREKGTAIHRVGGWGNELVARLSWNGQGDSSGGILDLLRSSCEVFDELAPDMLPGYSPRGPLLLPSIESARQICSARASAGQ